MDIDNLLEGLSDDEESSKSQFSELLDAPNDISFCVEIDNAISTLYDKISQVYQQAAPELSRIVPDKILYCKIVEKIGADPTVETDLSGIVNKQTAMAIQLSPRQSPTIKVDLDNCLLVDQLVTKRNQILEQVSKTIEFGNLLAIISPTTCTQLLAYTGGLESLASTPSANIPSLGSSQRAPQSGAARQGFLWSDPIFKGVDPQNMRSATRIVAGKLVLAARIDLVNPQDPTNGQSWAAYITERLDKLGAPPPNKIAKALPVPTEFNAKVRGGKRARKFKEKYHMSEIQKQSNRLEFGISSAPATTNVTRGAQPSQLELSKQMRERLRKK